MTSDKTAAKTTLNIAHRGASSIAPENTLIAARKAHQLGADWWELDVRLTQDKQLVVIHDDTLARTTNVEEVYPNRDSLRVEDFTLEEIKNLDAGSWFEVDDPSGEIARGNLAGSDIERYRGIKVPTLREALELTKNLNWRVDLEVKLSEAPGVAVDERPKTITKGIVSLVEELGMDEEVVVSSFDHSLVKLVEGLNSRIPGGILVKERQLSPVRSLQVNGAKFYGVSGSLLTRVQGEETLRKIHEADDEFEVLVWTVNNLENLKKLTANPLVDGLITDYPQRLTKLLNEPG
ncbi:glycerophosphodiester phosphodiesterase [Candidatus Bipolaricaulota bacterium]|nr:glycerophosphodiester phosphodiesterase [Candidatus Bipolaricaulota bacterium]MBS3814150.1 glycerophosphodiester phosphodiesterase [Candidatus Bipolaricaulota bacterium]